MWRWVGCAIATIGCSPPIVTGSPLVASTHLVVVAHQDDDLIFMHPDLDDAIARGESMTIVFVTQGLASEGEDKITARSAGTEAAYTHVAHSDAWQCGWIQVAGLPVKHCRLADQPLSLVYLGYPDGGEAGEHADSLLHLWEGTIAATTTIGALTAPITRDQLVAEVAAIVSATSPRVIHTQDLGADHGRDHPDHVMVGALTAVAIARSGSNADVIAYRGYNTPFEPVNKLDADYDHGAWLLGFFMACFDDCDACGIASCTTIADDHAEWLHRRYAIARRHLPLAGQLANDTGRCLGLEPGTDTALALVDCATAPAWRFERDGTLRGADGRCVTSGALVTCDGTPSQAYLFDDDGVIWAGAVPGDATDDAHLACLAGATIALCGGDQPTTHWTITRAPASTDLAANGLAGAPLVLGDVLGSPAAEICAATSQGVRCAIGIGDGTFGAGVWLQGDGAPLVVDPATLRLGDVDGDGRADACGRRDDQIFCALAAEQFVTPRPWLAIDAAFDATTITIDHGRICARDGDHATCTARSAAPIDLGAVPTGPLWLADLDGDGVLDHCTADANGPACARARDATTALWAYSLNGTVEGSLAGDGAILDPTRAVLADVDGDALPDLCRLTAAGVACAPDQTYAFGPGHLVAGPGDALVIGDLDGDGRADVCTITGATLACTRSP